MNRDKKSDLNLDQQTQPTQETPQTEGKDRIGPVLPPENKQAV